MVGVAEVAREAAVSALTEWLIDVFGFGRVRSDSSVEVSGAGPEGTARCADVVVLAGLSREYWGRYPSGSETLLVVEVAAADLESSLKGTADLYARAGVPEYWVLDLPGRFLYLCRKPFEGRYAEVQKVPETAAVSTATRPEVAAIVNVFLPATEF